MRLYRGRKVVQQKDRQFRGKRQRRSDRQVRINDGLVDHAAPLEQTTTCQTQPQTDPVNTVLHESFAQHMLAIDTPAQP